MPLLLCLPLSPGQRSHAVHYNSSTVFIFSTSMLRLCLKKRQIHLVTVCSVTFYNLMYIYLYLSIAKNDGFHQKKTRHSFSFVWGAKMYLSKQFACTVCFKTENRKYRPGMENMTKHVALELIFYNQGYPMIDCAWNFHAFMLFLMC